ncbi:aminodeoxychorismate synthase component I [Leminorella grimontii]|uniref:aminodeoxychorismate synthase component I n=1 Tax=Leminorella grimontii TaxID=82981 RepID=UPI0021C4A974|nr:aminodeoxychorismate synthase component I [Leminorella grimontii]
MRLFDVTLRFDFNQRTTLFRQPLRIIQTHRVDEVVECLHDVEQAVAQGYYAAGFIAYEAAPAFQPFYRTPPQGEMPLLWFGIYQNAESDDEKDKSAIAPPLAWSPLTDVESYRSAIARIRKEIWAGNTYQTNYTIRLESCLDGCDEAALIALYSQLKDAQRADYCAFLDCDRFKILSASPELFFHWKAGSITTRPMKGTAARGLDAEGDLAQRAKLMESEKDRAENVMIVDLLRNDLSQIAEPGSVKVPSLFDVEQYPTVWQMTSTVTAKTRSDVGLTDVFRALFPCGSITGAPKASTMRLIAELEPLPREVYCGAIGYVTPQGEALFNVPIRTVVIDTQTSVARYGVGGGITWDSSAENEYQEVIDKTRVLKGLQQPEQLLESLLLKNGGYTLLDKHLSRLAASARYFNFRFDKKETERALRELASANADGSHKVRLLLDADGELELSAEAVTPLTTPLTARWSPFPVNSQNRLLYHKTTLRDAYPKASLDDEYLLYNERDEITEFVNGNVALLQGGRWLTPALACGLLPGTEREALLEAGKIEEAVIPRKLLAQAQGVAFFNSVRGWREVEWGE